jgi:hypothetical protein
MSAQVKIVRRELTCQTVVPLLARLQREYGTESDEHGIDPKRRRSSIRII